MRSFRSESRPYDHVFRLDNWRVRDLLILVLAVGNVFFNPLAPLAANGPDPSRLEGRWLRTDGGYILELSAPGPDGQLTAMYFNPKQIHVERSAWKHQEGYLGVFVELRAPKYPGSTYTLAYDSARDRLVGLYFQAALQQQFNVEFERTP